MLYGTKKAAKASPNHLGAYQLQQKKFLIRKVKRCTRGIFSPFYMLMFP